MTLKIDCYLPNSLDWVPPFVQAPVRDPKAMHARIIRFSSKFIAALVSLALSFLIDLKIFAQSITTCDEAGLRAAIQQGGTFNLQCDGVITLSQTIVISNSVVLNAAGYNVALSGGNKVQLFQVQSNASLTLIGLTLQNGYATQGGAILNDGVFTATNCLFKGNTTFAIYGVPGSGGAIFTRGTLNLDECMFEQNSACSTNVVSLIARQVGYGGRGGAVYVESGRMLAQNCSWLENSAEGGRGDSIYSPVGGYGEGGAIFGMAGELELLNNTFASNRLIGGQGGPGCPGGDAKGGAIYVSVATAHVFNATIAFNTAIPGCGGLDLAPAFSISVPYGIGRGAGVYNDNGRVFLANSILATNLITGPVDPTGRGDPYPQFTYSGNYFGPVDDLRFNISSDDSLPISKSRTDPQLGPLDFHGGVTKSFGLSPTSPAIDFANDRNAPRTDQRGVSRSSGRTADAGAFELESQPVMSSDTTALRNKIMEGGKIILASADYFNVGEPIEITKDTEIEGPSQGAVFDGLGGSRVFHVAAGVKFTLSNVSIVNGSAKNGAGIFNEGVTHITDCRLTGNMAVGPPGTPGTNSFVRGAPGGTGSNGQIAQGGAIDNTGSLFVSNCFFINNGAKGGEGGSGGKGGPAASYYLSANYRGCRSGALGGSGGNGGSGASAKGAAICNSGMASIRNSQFGFNNAVGGTGGNGGDSGPKGCNAFGANNRAGNAESGGAAAGTIFSTGPFAVSESTFYRNATLGGTGGLGGFTDSYQNIQGMGGNGGNASGGCLTLLSTATLTNVTIADSSTRGGSGGSFGFTEYSVGITNKSGSGGNAIGGAIQVDAPTTIVSCTLLRNESIGGAGGPANGGATSPGLPGTAIASTLYNASSIPMTVKNSIILTSNDDDVVGPLSDGGYNIASGAISALTAMTSLTNTDPRLIEVNLIGTLPFYRPALDSPARDAVLGNGTPPIDQRGLLRPVGSAADIGAIELALFEIPPTISLDSSSTMSLTYIGHPQGDYALYSSTDFQAWTPVETNRANNIGHFAFESLDRISTPHKFYQILEVTH